MLLIDFRLSSWQVVIDKEMCKWGPSLYKTVSINGDLKALEQN